MPAASARLGRRAPRRDVIRERRTWLSLPASYLVALLVLAITIAPMLYMVVGGFSTTAQLNANPNAPPHPWVWSNYAAIPPSSLFWEAVANSVVIAVVATGLAVTLGSMAAFALSRYTFRGREGVYVLFGGGLVFP